MTWRKGKMSGKGDLVECRRIGRAKPDARRPLSAQKTGGEEGTGREKGGKSVRTKGLKVGGNGGTIGA